MRKVAKRPAFLRMRQRLEIAQKVMAANATSEAPATEPQRNLRFSPCRPSRLSKMRWTRHPMPHKRCGPLTLEWGAGFPKCGGGGIEGDGERAGRSRGKWRASEFSSKLDGGGRPTLSRSRRGYSRFAMPKNRRSSGGAPKPMAEDHQLPGRQTIRTAGPVKFNSL